MAGEGSIRDVHESRGDSRWGDRKTERDRMIDITVKVKSVERQGNESALSSSAWNILKTLLRDANEYARV